MVKGGSLIAIKKQISAAIYTNFLIYSVAYGSQSYIDKVYYNSSATCCVNWKPKQSLYISRHYD